MYQLGSMSTLPHVPDTPSSFVAVNVPEAPKVKASLEKPSPQLCDLPHHSTFVRTSVDVLGTDHDDQLV